MKSHNVWEGGCTTINIAREPHRRLCMVWTKFWGLLNRALSLGASNKTLYSVDKVCGGVNPLIVYLGKNQAEASG